MALITREVELIIIARDGATSTLARVGGAVAILGAAIARLGLKGVDAFRQMTVEAIDFRNELAYALTQVELPNVKIEDLLTLVRRIGSETPVPLEELNQSLYDIFSTLDLDTLGQAADMLKAFADSAVAGQAPIQDIGRSVIAWLNALNLAPTLDNVNNLLAIQFELVKKGAGTYTEFAGEIGKAIPAFATASQPVTEFGGALAFLTRNGLNAAMASTSAARAIELLYQPKALKELAKLGIETVNAQGHFRNMSDVIGDLIPLFAGLSDAQRRIKFQKIFGVGRIQARRFFDLVIPNYKEYKALVGDMENSAPDLARAYDIMFNEPAQQLKTITNRWQILRQEVGDNFIPKVKDKLIPLLNKLFNWWGNLGKEMQGQIVQWVSIAAIGATVFGVILALVGVFLLIGGLMAAFGITLGTVAVAFFGVLAAVVAVAAAIYLIIKNWDVVKGWLGKFVDFLKGMWGFFKPLIQGVVDTFKEQWAKLSDWWSGILEKYAPLFKETFDTVTMLIGVFVTDIRGLWGDAKETTKSAFGAIRELIVLTFKIIKKAVEVTLAVIQWVWENYGDQIIKATLAIWGIVRDTIETVLKMLKDLFDIFAALFAGDWSALWVAVKQLFIDLWNGIVSIFGHVLDFMSAYLTVWGDILSKAWSKIWEGIKKLAGSIWGSIKGRFEKIWTGIKNFFVGIWNGIVSFFVGIWESIVGTTKSTGEAVSTFWSDLWNSIADFFKGIWNGIVEFITGVFDTIVALFDEVWNSQIVVLFRDVWGILYEIVRIAVQTIWEIIKAIFNVIRFTIVTILKAIATSMKNAWEGIASVAKDVWIIISSIIKGVALGLWGELVKIWDALVRYLSDIWNVIATAAQTIWSLIKEYILGPLKTIWDVDVIIWNAILEFLKTIWQGIVSAAKWVWNWIKEIIVDKIEVVRNTIRTVWSGISTWLPAQWENIKAAAKVVWGLIRDYMIDPIREAWVGLQNFFGRIIDGIRNLFDKVSEWASKIHDALRKVNPAEWFSPPITMQVAKGMSQLTKNVMDPLRALQRDISNVAPNIRSQMDFSGGMTSPLGASARLFNSPTNLTIPLTVELDGQVIAEKTLYLTGLQDLEQSVRAE